MWNVNVPDIMVYGLHVHTTMLHFYEGPQVSRQRQRAIKLQYYPKSFTKENAATAITVGVQYCRWKTEYYYWKNNIRISIFVKYYQELRIEY